MGEMIANLNFVDYAVLAILAISAILSTLRGMTREFLGLAGWFAAIFVARVSAPTMADLMAPYLGIDGLVEALAFAVPFAATAILWFVLANIISPSLRQAGLGGLDAWFGVLFGLLRGFVIVWLLWLGALLAFEREENLPPAMLASQTAPFIRLMSEATGPLLPAGLKERVATMQASGMSGLGEAAEEALEKGSEAVDNMKLLDDEKTQ